MTKTLDITKSNAHLIGNIGENFAFKWLVEHGYEICDPPHNRIRDFARADFEFWFPNHPIYICDHIKCKYHDTNPQEAASKFCKMYNFCKRENGALKDTYSLQYGRRSILTSCPCLASFPEICDYCEEKTCTTSEFFKLIEKHVKESYLSFPDFIAHKDGNNFLVEVKVNQGAYRKHQIKFMRDVEKIGFMPILLEINLEISYSINEIKI